MSESPLDRLWKEYSLVFRDFDDLTLARWMSQTLGQLEGRVWRLSHPLLGAYRLAAQLGFERQIWLQRIAAPPAAYPESPCCRAPLLPLFTRDILESGLICQHCGGTAVPFEQIQPDLQGQLRRWSAEYAKVHAVAHWEESERNQVADYEAAYEEAAHAAEKLLVLAGNRLIPQLGEFYPTLIWEDQDECLEVRPEDIEL